MAQVVVRVVLEAHGRRRRPLRMLLGRSLLRQTGQLDLLALPQLGDHRALALGVSDDRVANRVVHALALDHQVARVDNHQPATTAHVQ